MSSSKYWSKDIELSWIYLLVYFFVSYFLYDDFYIVGQI